MNQTLRVAIIPPKRWWQFAKYRTEEDLTVAGVTVPKGFITDGATVSRWWVAAGLLLILAAHMVTDWLYPLGVLAIMLPALFPRVGLALKAAIVHDFLLDQGFDRIYADRKFKQALIELNVHSWRINMMFAGVRLYSFFSYLFTTLKTKSKHHA